MSTANSQEYSIIYGTCDVLLSRPLFLCSANESWWTLEFWNNSLSIHLAICSSVHPTSGLPFCEAFFYEDGFTFL